VEATGLYRGSIPGSGPAANTDDTQVDPQSQYIMRTILRTKSSLFPGALVKKCGVTHSVDTAACGSAGTHFLAVQRRYPECSRHQIERNDFRVERRT
jgi:hypothetical protein